MRSRYIFFVVMVVLLFSQAVLAQDDSPSCAALIEQHLTTVQQGCSALAADTACYGAGTVSVAAADAAPVDGFSQPGDRASLAALGSLQTVVLDPANEQWGLAVLNVQADVPMAHDGPALTFIMLGDVSLENLVPAASALQMAEPVDATTMVATNVRDVPSLNSNVIASASAGTEVQVDGLSADQEWVRIMYDGRVAWVSRSLVASEGSFDALPRIGRSSRSLMQEFTFTTGSGLAACSGALPALLIVQGPANIPVSIVANGADIRISSTIALWITPDGEIRVLVLSGAAQIGNLALPAGFTSKAQLSADGRTIAGPWQNVRPMTPGERGVLLGLEQLPPDIMSYAITIPTEEAIQQTLVALASSVGGARAGAASGQADCTRFKPTSPLGGMAFDEETFYWDGALGANNYRVNIYNEAGGLAGSFATNSENTALSINVSADALGEGISFGWEVEALVDNAIACTTGRIPVLRAAGAQLAGGAGGGDPDNPGNDPNPWD